MTLFWHNHFATAYTQDRRRARQRRRRAVHGREAVRGSEQVKGQIELLREYALGNFRDLLVAVAKDTAMLVWLDGRTNVKGTAAGELRARADGAVHDGRRHVRGGGRLRRRARVHRLEPDARPSERATTRSSTSPASTTRPRRSSRFRSIPTAAGRSRRVPPTPGMQDGIDLINAVAGHPGDRAAARAQALRVLRQRSRSSRTPAFDRRARRARTIASGFEMKPVIEQLLLSPQFTDAVEPLRAVFVAGGVRRALDQGNRLDGILGRTTR